MKISQTGLKLIKEFEGCHLTAYKDPVGIPTIGYGHTKGVKLGQKITQAQADEYLKQDVASSEKAVSKYKYNYNQNQFDALVSFTYNCGAGNLKTITANGTRTLEQISARLPNYNKAGGKVLAGLTRRRIAEKLLFDKPVKETPQTSQTAEEDYNMKTIKKGSTGKAVKIWQLIIGVSVDGDFGAKTETATKTWQSKHGLTADGVVGAKTWKAGLESV